MKFQVELFLHGHYQTHKLIEIEVYKVIGTATFDALGRLQKTINDYIDTFDELETEQWYKVTVETNDNGIYFEFSDIMKLIPSSIKGEED